jgi:16S rRNA (guanine527-N7)-methyltransferase
VVLLDSNSKKTAFLQQVAIELGLANIAVHCGRVEAYRPTTRFAVITARGPFPIWPSW